MVKSSMLALVLILTACIPTFPGQVNGNLPQESSPTPDMNLIQMTNVQTKPVLTSEPLSPPQIMPSSTFTTIPNPASPDLSITPTSLSMTSTASSSTLISTVPPGSGSFAMDTLPPGTDYGLIHLENKSNRPADVTLYCTTEQGYQTIIDYSNIRSINIKGPLGNYSYLVYVNGVKFTGSFSFLANQKLTLTIYRDKVIIH